MKGRPCTATMDSEAAPAPPIVSDLPRRGWKILVAIAGTSVFLSGVALTVLPVPSTLVMLAGLAILATEFSWAKSLRFALHARFRRIRHAPPR